MKMTHFNNRSAIVPLPFGPLVPWALVLRVFGSLVLWPLGLRSKVFGPLVPWSNKIIGPLVPWSLKNLGPLVLWSLIPLFLGSCGESEFEYSSHRVRLVYDNSLHLDATLSVSMNAMAPGTFCRVSVSGNYFTFTNSHGQSSRQPMTSVEQQRLPILGVNNESGVIVGFGLLSDPPVFYAYDAQCPNCYENDSRPRYLLSMTTDGKAKCSRCGRTYDMNNSGIIIDGGPGEKLYRYHATTTGPNGILSVNN